MVPNILHLIEYLVFLAISILLLVFFHNYFTFFLLVFLAVFPFLSIFLETYVLKRLTCSLKLPKKTALLNAEADISVALKNPTWIPLLGCTVVLQAKNHFFPESETVQIQIPGIAKCTNVMSFPISSSLNGNIELTISKLIVHDMLHIVTRKRTISYCNELSILPIVTGEVPFLQNARINGMEAIQDFSSPAVSENMLDVREYQLGDRLQHIHWKLSAKRDNLLVKEFESNAEVSLCILLELWQDKSLSDALNLVYTLCLQHLNGNRLVWLNWWSSDQNTILSKCLQSQGDIQPTLFLIYMENTYLAPDLAYQNFQPESIGFSSFYYIKKDNTASEGGICVALEEK